MKNIQKFNNDNRMFEAFAGCSRWPIIPGKENDGYREPVFAYIGENILIIIDRQCAQVTKLDDLGEAGFDEYLTLDWKFETQREAIEYLEMINPTEWRHFGVLGFK